MKRKLLALALPLACLVGSAQAQAPAVPAGPLPPPVYRAVDPENVIVIDTNKGRIIIELTPYTAPKHVERVRTLVRAKFYDGLNFFRVIDEFMAQTGDPENKGTGGSELPDLPNEFLFRRGADLAFTPVGSQTAGFIGLMPVYTQPNAQMALTADNKVPALPYFCAGVIGMAKNSLPDSANSQFFIMRYATPRLNGNYTALGRVISGLDVARSIKTGEPVPDPQDKMLTVRVLADIPTAERPNVQALQTSGPAFEAYTTRLRGEKGLSFSICDVDVTTPAK